MINYKKAREIINKSNLSIQKNTNGKDMILDSKSFKGMSISAQQDLTQLFINGEKQEYNKFYKKIKSKPLTVADIRNDASDMHMNLIENYKAKEFGTALDTIKKKVIGGDKYAEVDDSLLNHGWNVNTGDNPINSNILFPNVYISPMEASSLYSQKGLLETIVNKKSKSILMNGIKIKNSRLSAREIDKITENMIRLDLAKYLSESTLDSLVYGGSLLFPMLKKDNPLTMRMNLAQLAKYGILGKGCIDRFINVDRWNTFIIPPYSPTQRTFERPEVYTIPYLGSDVHNSRTGRIVTARQAGWWGAILNQGWGISDFCGYVQSAMNYEVAIKTVPIMIQQMSIVARTINVDGILANEGANALRALNKKDSMIMREMSANNPVTLDILGELSVINRDFSEVAELIRICRQDTASKADIPEPLLFSSEKGNFASGDDTSGNLDKQWEAIKTIHKSIEPQFKQIAKMVVIDTLGVSQRVIDALPYTQIHFDEPIIANASERAKIAEALGKATFQFRSANIPMDKSVSLVSKYAGDEMSVSSEILDELQRIQKESDDLDKEKKMLEIDLLKEQVKQAKKEAEAPIESKVDSLSAPTGTKIKNSIKKDDKDKKKSYDRLEQQQHTKTKVSAYSKRFEGVQRNKNKIAGVSKND